MSKQNDLYEKFKKLSVSDIHFGLATIVCTGRSRWSLPGGQELKTPQSALLAAKILDSKMRGKR